MLQSPLRSDFIWYSSFSFWLTSRHFTISRLVDPCCCKWNCFLLFYGCQLFYSIVYMYHIFFIDSCVSVHQTLCPCLSYCYQYSYEHKGSCIFLNDSFVCGCTQEWDCCIAWQFCFWFFGASPCHFSQWLCQVTFPPTVQKASLSSAPSIAFAICKLLNDGHADWLRTDTSL